MEKLDSRIDPIEFADLIHSEMASYGPFSFTVEEMSWGFLRLRPVQQQPLHLEAALPAST